MTCRAYLRVFGQRCHLNEHHRLNRCPGPATPLPITTLQSSLSASAPPAPGPTAGSHQLGGAAAAAAEPAAAAKSTKRGKKRSQEDQE